MCWKRRGVFALITHPLTLLHLSWPCEAEVCVCARVRVCVRQREREVGRGGVPGDGVMRGLWLQLKTLLLCDWPKYERYLWDYHAWQRPRHALAARLCAALCIGDAWTLGNVVSIGHLWSMCTVKVHLCCLCAVAPACLSACVHAPWWATRKHTSVVLVISLMLLFIYLFLNSLILEKWIPFIVCPRWLCLKSSRLLCLRSVHGGLFVYSGLALPFSWIYCIMILSQTLCRLGNGV